MSAIVHTGHAVPAARFNPEAAPARAPAQAPQAGLIEWIMDALAEASWLVAMSRLGLGLSPELIALHGLEVAPGAPAAAASGAACGIQSAGTASARQSKQPTRNPA